MGTPTAVVVQSREIAKAAKDAEDVQTLAAAVDTVLYPATKSQGGFTLNVGVLRPSEEKEMWEAVDLMMKTIPPRWGPGDSYLITVGNVRSSSAANAVAKVNAKGIAANIRAKTAAARRVVEEMKRRVIQRGKLWNIAHPSGGGPSQRHRLPPARPNRPAILHPNPPPAHTQANELGQNQFGFGVGPGARGGGGGPAYNVGNGNQNEGGQLSSSEGDQPDPVGGFGGGGNFYTGPATPAGDSHQGQVDDGVGNWGTPQQLPQPKGGGGGGGQGGGQHRSAQLGGDTPAQDPDPGVDDFGYGGDPIDDSPTEPGGDPVENSDDDAERNAVAAGQALPEYTGDQEGGSSDDDPNNVDPSIVTTDGGGGDPNPDDPDGSDESPSIPGRGFHPHGGNTGGARPNFPDPGDVATGGPFAGWTSGDGGDWGGNPHENPDPEDTGGSSNINPAAVAQNNANPDDLHVPNVAGDAGGNQDDFWAGNNPHYMPYQGAAWTPVAHVSRVTKASTVSRTIMRAGTVHFR